MTDKKCVCGCGQSLEGRGANFASPACVLRAMLKSPDLAKAFGEDNLKHAIEMYDIREQQQYIPDYGLDVTQYKYFTIGDVANYRAAMIEAAAKRQRIYKDIGGHVFATVEEALKTLTALNKHGVWGIFILASDKSFSEIAVVDEAGWVVLNTQLPIVGEFLPRIGDR